MQERDAAVLNSPDADDVLRTIVEGTAAATGEGFFRALVQSLARATGTHGAWVTQYVPERRLLRGLAFWLGGRFVEGYEVVIDGTPCEAVVEGRRLLHVPDNIVELYPDDAELRNLELVSYLGVPLLDADGRVLGHLAVLDRRPMPLDPRLLSVFRIFAARAGAEHLRHAAEARVREREQTLTRVIDGAMDAILDLEETADGLRVAMANPAAGRVFRCPPAQLASRPFDDLLTPAARATFAGHVARLARGGGGGEGAATSAVWLPEPMEGRRADGEAFAAEATLSRYASGGRTFYTLVLRDVADRVAAERTIRSLAAHARYLRDELRALHNSDQLLGQSDAMRHVLRDVEQVATTDASVLVLGETGTGKELVARAIHAASRRRDGPLIRVNCAAIPAALMESEFFGHEKGAFTGATQRRDGRFALADGGTLFLDEVGELPVDLQVKLLRALQEGEFEPVGSGRTVRVDVRVVAATNRDLPEAIRAGRFREDLYYRLNVFPIRVPPLRERKDDVAVLARAFAARAAQRAGRAIEPPDEQAVRRLRAYAWPGNVRELQNVIERAVITSRDGRLNLDRALPDDADPTAAVAAPREAASADPPPSSPAAGVRTAREFEALERENVLRALEASRGRIAGDGGAAELLGMNPSTLRSRMKALGVQRATSG